MDLLNQLLKTIPKMDSLCMKYDLDHCNSGWKWLERWMAASPWKSGLSVQANNTVKCLNNLNSKRWCTFARLHL